MCTRLLASSRTTRPPAMGAPARSAHARRLAPRTARPRCSPHSTPLGAPFRGRGCPSPVPAPLRHTPLSNPSAASAAPQRRRPVSNLAAAPCAVLAPSPAPGWEPNSTPLPSATLAPFASSVPVCGVRPSSARASARAAAPLASRPSKFANTAHHSHHSVAATSSSWRTTRACCPGQPARCRGGQGRVLLAVEERVTEKWPLSSTSWATATAGGAAASAGPSTPTSRAEGSRTAGGWRGGVVVGNTDGQCLLCLVDPPYIDGAAALVSQPATAKDRQRGRPQHGGSVRRLQNAPPVTTRPPRAASDCPNALAAGCGSKVPHPLAPSRTHSPPIAPCAVAPAFIVAA